MYDEYAPQAINMGYHVHPISPPGFKPDKTPVLRALNGKFIKYKGWTTDRTPVRTPQPGAGIGIRCGDNGVIAIDCDDDEAAPAIAQALSPSPVYKVGQRGGTGFYRADFEVPSENFYDSAGRLILQVLSAGRQTVIPPSIHPSTNRPYCWTNGRSVYDTPVNDLPLLPRDYRDRILGLGYGPKERRSYQPEHTDPETGEIKNKFDDNPCAELNAVALKNLDKWVMSLGIAKLRKQCGRFPSYRGVAQWRPSTTGKALDDRDTNLSICGSGIKDFGTDQTYSPLDLTMAARACDLGEAFCWLEEKLLPQKPDIEIDLDKIIAAQEAPSIAADESPELPQPQDDDGESYSELEKDLEVVGALWLLNDPLPEPKPMTVPFFVPSRSEPCIGYIGAVTGSVKTFVADDLAVSIASKGLFAGQQITEPGAVVLIEMEGSSRTRLRASVQYRGVEGQSLPVIHIQRMPPPILHKNTVSKEWKDWCVRIIRLVRWRMRKEGWDIPLTAIILDPLAHFSGLTDIGSFTENTTVSKALIDLALAAKCLVIVVDHYGKDTTRGLVGSIARESLAYFVLTPGEKLGADLSKPRQLVVRKMKDGMNSICVDYRLHVWDTNRKQVVDAEDFSISLEEHANRTLVIEWGKEVRRFNESDQDEGVVTALQRTVLNKLNQLLNAEGNEPPAECGCPAGLKAIRFSRLQEALRRSGLSKTAVTRCKTELLARDLIGTYDDYVWIALGGT